MLSFLSDMFSKLFVFQYDKIAKRKIKNIFYLFLSFPFIRLKDQLFYKLKIPS